MSSQRRKMVNKLPWPYNRSNERRTRSPMDWEQSPLSDDWSKLTGMIAWESDDGEVSGE